LQILAIDVADINVGTAALAQDHGDATAVRRHRGAGVQAGVLRKHLALSARKIVGKNVRIAELVGSVKQSETAAGPRRSSDNGVVVSDFLGTMAVEVGDVDFAVRAG